MNVGRTILVVALAAALGSHISIREQRPTKSSSRVSTTNPRQLRALQLLDRRLPGALPRIRWSSRRVEFEVSLAEGAYSWSVVALFGANEHGDFAHATSVSFEVR